MEIFVVDIDFLGSEQMSSDFSPTILGSQMKCSIFVVVAFVDIGSSDNKVINDTCPTIL